MNALDYHRRANEHRPTDPAAIAAEIRRLHASGLTSRDIAGALRLNISAVLEALHTPSPDSRPSSDPGHGSASVGLQSRVGRSFNPIEE